MLFYYYFSSHSSLSSSSSSPPSIPPLESSSFTPLPRPRYHHTEQHTHTHALHAPDANTRHTCCAPVRTCTSRARRALTHARRRVCEHARTTRRTFSWCPPLRSRRVRTPKPDARVWPKWNYTPSKRRGICARISFSAHVFFFPLYTTYVRIFIYIYTHCMYMHTTCTYYYCSLWSRLISTLAGSDTRTHVARTV